MRTPFLLATLLLMTTPSHASDNAVPPPPDVARKPHVVTAPFGATREDPYYWLRDDTRKDAAMLAYLEAENAYVDTVMAPLAPLQETLYEEIVGRIKQDDSSVPYRERGFWYYTRDGAGQDDPIRGRRPDVGGHDAEAGSEAWLLDVNARARGKDSFRAGDSDGAPDNPTLAWAGDDVGPRQYKSRFR